MWLFATLSGWWQRVRNPFLRIIDWLPFTVGGGIFLLSSVWATWYFGVQRTDLVLIILGSVGIALSILGCVLTIVGALWMQWRFRELPLFSATMTVQGQHRVFKEIRLPWWIPLIQVDWTWQSSKFDVKTEKESECVTPQRRGMCNLVCRSIQIGDAFGICEVTIRSQQPSEIQVLPRSIPLLMPDIAQGLRHGGEQANPLGASVGERVDIRNYALGDPMRYILWKAYARTGELVVRTPERAFEPSKRLLAYLVVHPDDGLSASLATQVIHSQSLGDNWAFGVDGRLEPCTDIETAIEAVVQSGDSTIQNAQGLSDFINQETEASSLIVFAPATDGEWVDAVMQISHQVHTQVIISGILPQRRKFIQDVLFDDLDNKLAGQFAMDVFDIVTRRLEKGGVVVKIVAPSIGTVMTPRDLMNHWERQAS